jgi:hypothetical protein
MKTIALLILSVGVAVCASYGARLSPNMRDELAVKGKGSLTAGAEATAKAAYCAARAEAKLAFDADCPDPAAKAEEAKPEAEKTAEAAAPTREALVAKGRARVDALKTTAEPLAGKVLEARRAWIAAAEAAIEPGVDAQLRAPTPPGERVEAWATESGAPFFVGLFLVLVGAVLGRKAVKKEALGDSKKGGAPAVDFGALLAELLADVQALAAGMDATAAPQPADLDRVKVAIEALQLEKFAPLVEARTKLQARYGLAGYAEVFGPFSGGERRVNRAWSALVDLHWPEAHDSLHIAAEQLGQADVAMKGLVAKAAGASWPRQRPPADISGSSSTGRAR